MRKALFHTILLVSAMTVNAQLEPLSSQYLLNTLSINPAYAGSREALSVTLLHRNQWTGFTGAPKTMSLALHAPMRNENIGLGILAVNDQRGISNSTVFNGNFAYRILTAKGVFSMGISAGVTLAKNSWTRLVAVDPVDDLLLRESRGYLLPDFGIGAYYQATNLFCGISMPMFLSHRFDAATGTFRLENRYEEYTYFLEGGYLFRPGATVGILPSFLVRLNARSTPQADMNLHLVFFDRIRTGISYRSNRSVIGLLMVRVNNQFDLAYSYDLGIGTTGRNLGSSHEIMLRYDFRYIIHVIQPRYF